jgi:alpha-L-arabinofuranosidase
MSARSTLLAGLTLSLGLLGCSAANAAPSNADSQALEAALAAEPTSLAARTTITVQAADVGKPLDARLFGTNVPAWVNPQQLSDPRVQKLTAALGKPFLRLPGGSWANHYDWLACENGDPNGCHWTWASKPTDFLNFVKATGGSAMWTVSFNGTSKEAAALVAFFNGSVNDTTLIGVDVRGKNWKRVQDWAKLRASHGNRQPMRIEFWEVGNEIYGAKPGFGGTNCASWGWEEVWTCDGNEYMLGKGRGEARREGYLEFRAAMRAVDSTIKVGAVGVDKPGEWWDWGNKVFEKGGANLDFYVIHAYGFNKTPANAAELLPKPQELWKDIFATTYAAMDRLGTKKRLPIAVTEYNMAAFQDLDNGQLMTRAVNALFIADMIGQLAEHGATMANQWNLANGRANNGTDYGLIDAQKALRNPQYYALRLWNTMGNTLLPLQSQLPAATKLSAYATRSADGTISVLAINKTDQPIDVSVSLAGLSKPVKVSVDVLEADALETTDILFNERLSPQPDFSNAPPKQLGEATGSFDYSLAKYSVTVLRFKP